MPKLRKYILAALLTAAACAALAQTPAPHKTDTVWDTVHDTVQIVQVAADTNDRYYRLAEKAVDHRMTVITVLLTFIGLMLASFSVALVVEGRRAARKIDQELEIARKNVESAVLKAEKEALAARRIIECDLDELKTATKAELEEVRSETDKSVKDIRCLTDEAQRHILETKEQAKKDLEEIAETKKKAAQHAADLETQFDELARIAEKVAAPAMAGPAEPDIRLEERLKLIETDDAQEAVDKYEQLVVDMEKAGIASDRIPVSIHRDIGLSYMALEKWPETIRELQAYVDAQPDDDDALFQLAWAHFEAGDYDQACADWERVTRLDQDHWVAFFSWGLTLAKLYDATSVTKWLHLACEKYKQTVSIEPDYHEAFYAWGNALYKLYVTTKKNEWLDLACQKYEQAVTIKPDYHEAFDNWSASLIKRYHSTQQKKYLEAAQKKSSRALELAPDHKNYKYNVACALALLGRKDDMLAALKEAIDYDAKYKKEAREDEDFKAYRGNADFIALTKENGGEQAG